MADLILKNLYHNNKKVPMIYNNGEFLYRCVTRLVFSVDVDNLSFNPTGETKTFNITANDNWSMTIPSWLTASALSGTGNATITLTAAATEDNRNGQVVITCNTKSHTIHVSQTTTLAAIGDIVVYSTADTQLHFIPQTNYNTTTYPTATYIPIGVVAMNQESGITQTPVTFMGCNWLDKSNPDSGNVSGQDIEWGDTSLDVPSIPNCADITAASADMNGKANTAAVLVYATGQTDWRTAASISFTDGTRMFPLFECAWRYYTSGTSQGDWYVPAFGQIYPLQQDSTKLTALNSGFTAIGVSSYSFAHNLGTSTEYSLKGFAWCRRYTSEWRFSAKITASLWQTRPFCDMLMTEI